MESLPGNSNIRSVVDPLTVQIGPNPCGTHLAARPALGAPMAADSSDRASSRLAGQNGHPLRQLPPRLPLRQRVDPVGDQVDADASTVYAVPLACHICPMGCVALRLHGPRHRPPARFHYPVTGFDNLDLVRECPVGSTDELHFGQFRQGLRGGSGQMRAQDPVLGHAGNWRVAGGRLTNTNECPLVESAPRSLDRASNRDSSRSIMCFLHLSMQMITVSPRRQ